MGAGDLRDRITVTRSAKVSNGRGGTTTATTTVADNLPASIVVRKGGEQLQAQRMSGLTPVDITVRYTPDTATITSADVATDQDGNTYAIKWAGSLDEGRKKWLVIMAEKGAIS